MKDLLQLRDIPRGDKFRLGIALNKVTLFHVNISRKININFVSLINDIEPTFRFC